jgi:hypothetical protein
VVTHRATLEQGPELYKTFRDKKDGCIKVVLKPWGTAPNPKERQEGISPR